MKNYAGQLLCGLAILPVAAVAQTVPLTQDSYFATNPATAANYGPAATVNVGGPNGDRALVQFDLTTLPTGTATPTATSLSCFTNAIANTIGSTGSCTDTTHTVSVNAGDTLSLALHESQNTNTTFLIRYGVHFKCQ